jgi:hypothetical protein
MLDELQKFIVTIKSSLVGLAKDDRGSEGIDAKCGRKLNDRQM